MAQASNLIDLILRLLKDPAALAEFQQNPDAVLAACGATTVSPEDVHDALVLADDNADDKDNGDDDNGGGGNGGHHHHVPPPPHPHPGESEHDAAVRYIKEYVTNNYVDDRDTNIDNSVNQQIHTDGGDVDQIIRTTSSTASGDGAVSAAGNIDHAAVTTGDDNQIGENNIRGDGNVQGDRDHVVSGDHNTTAFGSGAANSATVDHATVDGGGALSVSGPATADQHNSEYHQVSDTSDTTKVDVDHSFNAHEDATVGSHNSTEGHFTDDSHDAVDNNVLSNNSLQDVHPG
jgi:hypothetical protein